jgi:hypothetical protein
MTLKRVLREGIRPRWVVAEVMPAYLAHDGKQYLLFHMGSGDLRFLCRYLRPLEVYRKYFTTCLVKGREYQAEFLRRHAPSWFPPAKQFGGLAPLGGHVYLESAITPDECRRRNATAREQYRSILGHFQVMPIADRALRGLIDVCRKEKIELVLVVTPEGSRFKSWYPPGSERGLHAYLQELSRNYRVPVVDAGDWLHDGDFCDGHHAFASGAETFTLRLGREVLQPLITDRLAR